MTGQITQKSDVYSFGVVLLELLTGRKPVDHTIPKGQQSLVTWATPRLSEDKVKQCVDPKLNNDYPPKAIAKLAAVAALCVQYEADFRPNMTIVFVTKIADFNLTNQSSDSSARLHSTRVLGTFGYHAPLAAVAALCVQYEADFRPNMTIVVKALQPLLNAKPEAKPAGTDPQP
ncbi:hypothetical protein GOBAR_AA33158 [Gossypium barbadense]|uniref:Protein kinase domain-containing protein n=1 Tax=Gossypium barbadense TaxID=3634 RepID=A0A2P5W8Y2_GOSBA|nr:hypothetical protein GOBAR_AA33158 [Gossypium barbadense]